MLAQDSVNIPDVAASAPRGTPTPRPATASAAPSAFALRGDLSRPAGLAIALATGVAVLLLWEIAARRGWINAVYLPAPSLVIATLWTMAWSGELLENSAISITRVLVAFGLSAVTAIPIGIAMSAYRPVGAALRPIVDFVRYLPVPALVPLAIIWFGIGDTTKIFLLWLGTFFQLVLLVEQDMDRVPHEYIEIAATLGARPLEILTGVAWRAMLPGLFDNLRITLGWCWTYLIIAEITAASNGLGFVIMAARRFMQTPKVMAGVLAIGLIGLATDQLLRAAHGRLFRYLRP